MPAHLALALCLTLAAPVPDEPTVPPGDWLALQVPGCFTVQLPGTAKKAVQNAGPLTMVVYECSPSPDLMCGVGHSQGQLPPERRALPVERLLEDACDGAAANLKNLGATEASRKAIRLGEVAGREVVFQVQQGQGKLVTRVYVADGVLYMVMVGGKGIEPDGPIARKVFGSFQFLGTGPR